MAWPAKQVLCALTMMIPAAGAPGGPGALAGQGCAPRAAMLARLAACCAERPVATGLRHNGQLVILTAAPGGRWSILTSQPDGLTCLLAAGERWRAPGGAPDGAPAPRDPGA